MLFTMDRGLETHIKMSDKLFFPASVSCRSIHMNNIAVTPLNLYRKSETTCPEIQPGSVFPKQNAEIMENAVLRGGGWGLDLPGLQT